MWEALYKVHYPELVSYGTGMFRNRELAEDLAQETFVRAMTNAQLLEELTPGKRRAWLFRTFKNLFYDRYRRAVLENAYAQGMPTDEPQEQGIQDVENTMLLQGIREEDRLLFRLRYQEGYTAGEISEMLGIPAGTIRSRLSRCRQKLKESIEL